MDILEIIDLEKKYGSKKVLNKLSFNIKKGEIFGFLGPNGAGKSTTIKILSTVLKEDKGTVLYKGQAIERKNKEYKRQLGVVPQNLAIFENLSAYENIKFFAQFYNMKKKEIEKKSIEVLKQVGLEERRDELPSTFSGGMKRRLNIACALVHNPELLILDEPTVGVDPQSRNSILELIRNLCNKGTTVIYTTHYMEEVEAICDRVAIIDEGTLLKLNKIGELVKTNTEQYLIYGEGFDAVDIEVLLRIDGMVKVKKTDKLQVVCVRGKSTLNDLLQQLMMHSVKIFQIFKEEENLEKVFLELTGKQLRD